MPTTPHPALYLALSSLFEHVKYNIMAQCWTEFHQITDQILLTPPPLILIMPITSRGLGKYQYHIDNKNEEKKCM